MKNFIRKIIYVLLGTLDSALGKKNPVTIFAYHGISSDGWRFNTKISDFEKHIELLKKEYKFIALTDVEMYIQRKKIFGKPVVAFTFDDGYENILSIRSLIKKNKIKPTVFVIAKPENADRKEMGTTQALLNASQITQLKKDGWSIGCHSMTHMDFANLSQKNINREIIQAKNILEKTLRTKIVQFAFPKGKYVQEAITVLENTKFTSAYSMDDGKITNNTHMFKIPRVGVDASHSLIEFKYSNSPSVILFRQIIKESFLGKYIAI